MPLKPAVAAILASLAIAGAARAEGHGERGPGFAQSRDDHRHAFARTLPPEIRYRDPRYHSPRRRGPQFGPPVDLIQAYLPRTTETPLYNEPPSRFPRR
ncbi:hypothetical protein [Methylobacterium haplocladii]|uniref:Uncharacterized protein n=1 Tax=Methylobacterium haplocladii TaxID=1176176 RepID=A0A512IRK7_9HYPH|nr:hypothetical protein [Methylobacterium haplocladii]GEP00316.1 hypothetical protein MHA02_27030 [Methylobacterium haplocladii]GJD86087.1 hypothetical protein HPGCJGGD_3984 [Methylobacterium haplocladii]GLS60874.1 hypothetical protein GCM10007887_35630 [Methylobacterium haplocladii]